jgi:glycosyltransferase involved in cell wall biosynthesis
MFASTVRAAGLPIVFFLHDIATGTHWLERWAKWYPPDLVVANSHFTAGSLWRLYPGVLSQTLYPPVTLTPARPSDAARRALRASLGTDETEVVIVQVSRMVEWKGHTMLLEALGRLRAEAPWKLWIVGGAQRPAEERYAAGLRRYATLRGLRERVSFLGERCDVAELLSAADIFCQPNVTPEPFGIVFIEALAASLPVVATRMAGAIEIVTDACGILTPPSAVALACALDDLVANEAHRRRLAASGAARARRLCDPIRQVRRFEDALRTVVRNSSRTLPPSERTRPG